MLSRRTVVITMIVSFGIFVAAPVARAEILGVGIDRKFAYDEKGKRQSMAPGRDEVLFYDLKDPARPALIGSLPVENSIVGPPTNIAITPDQKLALVANALRSVKAEDGLGWKPAPADELHVVDLTQRPPKLIRTVQVGAQPSGVAINASGTQALVANRAGNSITVLSIKNGDVSVSDTLPMAEAIASVAFTPDGRRALAAKFSSHRVALLDIDEAGRVTYPGRDLPVGLFPWAVSVAPDGTRALVTNIGANAASDGNAKTASIIDLKAVPPRTIEHVTVGDAPEGVAISPDGRFAAVTVLQGSYDAPKGAWWHNAAGLLTLIKLDATGSHVADKLNVEAFPEGVAFSDDGRFVYVGNFASSSLSIVSLNADGRIIGHSTMKLPGPAASLRIGSR